MVKRNRNCVVKAHGAGLFSNINKVLSCMSIYDHVHVDWAVCGPNDPGYKYGQSFYGDCWDTLFEPTTPPEPPFDTIYEYPFYDITGACAGVMYQNPQWGWRSVYHKLWKELGCKIRPLEWNNTVGILVRSEVHGGEQLSGRSQSLEEYAAAIEQITDRPTNLMVVSSDMESIHWMEGRFPNHDVFFTKGVKRNPQRSTNPEQHLVVPQTKDDAVQVVQEVLGLAACRALIHPASNMATAALYINPELQSIYLK